MPKYTYNCVANIMIAKVLFPNWKIVIYYDNTVPLEFIEYFSRCENVISGDMTDHWLTAKDKMLWRNLAVDEEQYGVVCVRDLDGWLSYREKVLIDEWLVSDKNFHIIRDHCYHDKRIMGGMWGVRNGKIKTMEKTMQSYLINNPSHKTHTGHDQDFMYKYYYNQFQNDTLVHIGKQYNIKHQPLWESNGFFPEEKDVRLIHIPPFCENDEPVKGLSFRTVHELNKFQCLHCGSKRHIYIGGMNNTLSPEMISIIRTEISTV